VITPRIKTPVVYLAIGTALRAFEASPLSRKKALLTALLIDARIDREAPADDPLAYRANLSYRFPVLGIVMDLCAMRDTSPSIVLEAVTVSADEANTLREADYMVSLYNSATVQRVLIGWPDGRREDALTVLREAAAALERSPG
jgi:hypothetical protein